jgi:hypothetical protein
MFGLKI